MSSLLPSSGWADAQLKLRSYLVVLVTHDFTPPPLAPPLGFIIPALSLILLSQTNKYLTSLISLPGRLKNPQQVDFSVGNW